MLCAVRQHPMFTGHDQDRLARQWQPHALEPNRERERPVAIVNEKLVELMKQWSRPMR